MPAPAQKVALTDRSLKALKPASAGKRTTIWDALMPGLAVRVTDKGRISFVAVRRRPGDAQPTWHVLGHYPILGLADARVAAREALTALTDGKHPRELKRERRRAEERLAADRFGAVAENFASRLERGIIRKIRGGGGALRNAGEVAAIIRRELIVDALLDRPIGEITRRDVREVIEAILARGEPSPSDGRRRSSGGPYAARHALAAARRLFAWAVRQDLIATSPCDGLNAVELHGAPAARDRVLAASELRRIWQAADKVGYPFGPFIKLLLLTGQRRDEIADMQWNEINLGDALLLVPAERMKGNFAQTVPLVPTAIDIINGLPRFTGDGFALSTTYGKRPISGFSKMKARLDAAIAASGDSAIAPWTLHDLRRTVRTGLASVGVLPVIAELTIGHKQTGISAIYDRHRYDSEKRDALMKWEAKLRSIVAPPSDAGAKVVPLARASP